VLADDRACTRIPSQNFHGKEGVDGSSPSEGSAKAPQIGAFCLTGTCMFSSVRWVWSPSWSPQVHDARSKLAKCEEALPEPLRVAVAQLVDRTFDPLSIRKGPTSSHETRGAPNPPSHQGFRRRGWERFWNLAGATSGNRWQMGRPRKRQKQAKTVATGCDRLPFGAHGKECHEEGPPAGQCSARPRQTKGCPTQCCTPVGSQSQAS
jgi:hypothetical protein